MNIESMTNELRRGQKLITFMGFFLGAVAVSGFLKLLFVPHSGGEGLIILAVCSVSLFFCWTVITDERRFTRMLNDMAEDEAKNTNKRADK
jgi:hypothetical protein